MSNNFEDNNYFNKFVDIPLDEDTFIVEQFYTEFAINQKRIIELYESYNMLKDEVSKKRIKELFDKEISPIKFNINDIQLHIFGNSKQIKYPIFPKTILKPIFIAQSPKNTNNYLPNIHYALKETMLSDFRAKRNKVKKQLAASKDPTVKIQLSAKEKAIKVIMNSEYGQMGSGLFPYFDPDIAGGVTFASRRSISELTSCIYSKHFYVNDIEFLKPEINELIKKNVLRIERKIYTPSFDLCFEQSLRSLDEIEFIKKHFNIETLEDIYYVLLDKKMESSVEKDEFKLLNKFELKNFKSYNIHSFTKLDYILPPRRLTTQKTYDELLKDCNKEIYIINIEPSELVYQDTDSNYYTNVFIKQSEKVLNPESINRIMNLLMCHNDFMGKLIKSIILRPPIGVGFEGAFIVARYLNKKKKYYGKKWHSGMLDHLITFKNCKYSELDEYERENILNVEEFINDILKEYLFDDVEDVENDEYIKSFIIGLICKDEEVLKVCEKIKKLNNTFQKFNFKLSYDYKHLPENSDEFLRTQIKDSTIPFKNGAYMNTKLYNNEDFIDFITSFGIKCTGVDIARRDQFKFININNLLMMESDLQYKTTNEEVFNYDVENKIDAVFPLRCVVDKLIDDFAKTYLIKNDMNGEIEVSEMNEVNDLNSETNRELNNKNTYPIEYFCKAKKHNGSMNEIKTIMNKYELYCGNIISYSEEIDPNNDDNIEELKSRLRFRFLNNNISVDLDVINSIDQFNFKDKLRELKNKYQSLLLGDPKIPKFGDRVQYLVLNPFNDRFNCNNGSTVADKGFALDMLRYILNKDEYIFDYLDYEYYFEQLATVLSNYIVIEEEPDLVKYLDGTYLNVMSPKEIKNEMDKKIKIIKTKLARNYINKYIKVEKVKRTKNNKTYENRIVNYTNNYEIIRIFQDKFKIEFINTIDLKALIDYNNLNIYNILYSLYNLLKNDNKQFKMLINKCRNIDEEFTNNNEISLYKSLYELLDEAEKRTITKKNVIICIDENNNKIKKYVQGKKIEQHIINQLYGKSFEMVKYNVDLISSFVLCPKSKLNLKVIIKLLKE